MSKALEAVTFCKRNGERVSIPMLFMELREESDHEISFDVQNYEIGHEHLWDFLEGFEGNGYKGKIELEYSDHDIHLYRCKEYHMKVLQEGGEFKEIGHRMSLGRIELTLGKELR